MIYIKKLKKVIYPNDILGNRDKYGLTRKMAKTVRFLRCKRGYTWRAIAREIHDRYPQLKINRGNQIDGWHICDEAMVLLKEHCNYGNWN